MTVRKLSNEEMLNGYEHEARTPNFELKLDFDRLQDFGQMAPTVWLNTYLKTSEENGAKIKPISK